MKRLKTPLWLNLVYFIFVIVVPAIITALELFQSRNTIFKWSFASIGSILLLTIVLKKFVFKNKITKLEQKIILLEHDYNINVGDKHKIFTYWKRYTILLNSFTLLITLLSTILGWMFVTALANGLIAFRGAMAFILLFVIIGITFKIIAYMFLRGDYEN